MKKFIPFFIGIIICSVVSAQDAVDALRFSETFSGGTARSTAMGGAFGALGADFYSTSQNPAGLGFYRSSELIISPGLIHSKTKSTYLNTNTDDFKYSLSLNSFSYVHSGKNKKASFGIGFNRINNFNDYTLIKGTNSQSSLADHYAQTANYYSTLDPFTDGLFYDAYILNYDTVNNRYVVENSMFLPGVQKKVINRTGKINEWNLAMGFNFGDLVYFGTSLNILPLYYNESSNYSEYDSANISSRYFNLYEDATTSGTGLGAKFGFIITPIHMLHLGIAFHTPVMYSLNYSYQTSLVSQFVNGTVYPYQYEDGISNDYTLVTPYKAVGSLGLLFGKVGAFDVDVEYIDYSTMKLKNGSGGDDFSDVNDAIKSIYTKSFNVKTGAEVRLGGLYLRGGFGYYGSPYKTSEINKDAYHLNYSAGIGLRQSHFFVDFAWNYLVQKENYILYNWTDNTNTEVFYTSKLTKNISSFMTTFGIRF